MYRTLFNRTYGRLRVFVDRDVYIAFGITFGLRLIKVEFWTYGLGLMW